MTKIQKRLNDKWYVFKENVKFFSKKNPKKLLFEHIPKCGGSTITNYLIRQYRPSRTLMIKGLNPSESITKFKLLPEKNRLNHDLIIGHGAHQLIDYSSPSIHKATLFREPVDRIVSYYFFIHQTPKHYLYKQVVLGKMDFLSFVKSDITHEIKNNYIQRFLFDEQERQINESHVDECVKYLTDNYQTIGFLDEIDLFTKKLQLSLGFEEEYNKTYIKNQTHKRTKLEDVDQNVIDVIKEKNNFDIQLYSKLKKIYSDE